MSSIEPLSPRILQAFTQLIAERIGLTFRKNDQAALQSFILDRLQALRFTVPEEYYLLLNAKTDAGHQEWEFLISEITNTESFFFRDKGQFSLLKNYIFPKIIEQRSHQKTIRICSAGCSTGEEPYSIAILLSELLPEPKDWDIKILGVDINVNAIEKAKTGLYRPWSFRGIDPPLQEQFFQEINNQYQLHDNILAMVDFQSGNLVDDSFHNPLLDLQNMDLILCRNVFIYFSQAAIEKTVAKFYDALSPLGYLLVGHTELHNQKSHRFHIKMFEESIAYQRPTDGTTTPKSEFLSTPITPKETGPKHTPLNHEELHDLFKGNDIKMNQVALNLLRQLPSDSKIAKLGNRTASELITQIETLLKETN